MSIEHYDIIIVGGGVVGATFAAALGATPLRVALIDAREPQAFDPEGPVDLRVYALSHASQRILAGVEAWPTVAAHRMSPYREMHVWDTTGGGAIHFDSAAIGEPDLGSIVEDGLLHYALRQRLAALDNVELIDSAEIATLNLTADTMHVTLANGDSLHGRLVVGADGVNSTVRTLAGLTTRRWQYDQLGVVAAVRTEKPHRQTAWQCFMPDGVLAFLPLSDGRSSIVWSADQAKADSLLGLPDEAFCEAVGRASDKMLGGVLESGPRASFPLRSQYAFDYVQPRLALIGDAAHCVHPLAGQGLNLGLLDAAALAEVLQQALSERRDIGDYRVLRRYARWRKGDNLAMLTVLDGFKRLFNNRSLALRLARNAGLNIFDRAPPLKNTIMRRAMGLAGDLPKMAHETLTATTDSSTTR
jgi:2-octaprenylphenol hydroxylase